MSLQQSLAVVGLILMSCFSWADDSAVEVEVDATNYRTPLKTVALADYPVFSDDYDLRGMKMAIDRQLARYKQKKLTGTIHMGSTVYPLTKARDSLEAFSQLVDTFDACVAKDSHAHCYQDLNATIREKFNVFVPNLSKGDPRYGEAEFARFTGYNTHHVEGRLKPEGVYTHAIYAKPESNKLRTKSRLQIDFKDVLGGLGLESVYTDEPFDIYLMQVQGSGRATMTQKDGSVKEFYLQYDGSNSQRFTWVGPYMAKKGYITNGSIAAQRHYMRDHPDKWKEIFSQCPSYVYLIATDKPPTGCDSVAVTAGRTLALDNAYYAFKGLIAYVETQRPTENGHYNLDEENRANIPFSKFSRFFLDQDTGGAITGKARADIYFGADDYAFFAGMNEDELGKIHFLMLK